MKCKILKTGYLTLITPLSGKIFHRQGGTCYVKSMYQLGSLWVHPLRNYEWLCKMQKMGWFGVFKDSQGHGQRHHSIERIRLSI